MAHADDIPLTARDFRVGSSLGVPGGYVIKILTASPVRVRLGIGTTDGRRVKLDKPPNMKTGLTYVARMDTM